MKSEFIVSLNLFKFPFRQIKIIFYENETFYIFVLKDSIYPIFRTLFREINIENIGRNTRLRRNLFKNMNI